MTDVGRLLARLRRFRSPVFTGLAMLFVCLFIVALEPAPLAALRHVLFDGYQRVMPRDRKFAGAIVVAIDEAALQARGQWPWPRAQVAELLDAIGRARPLAIGVDILFAEPERTGGDGDGALARAVKSNGAVLGVAGMYERDRRFPDPPLAVPLYVRGGPDLALAKFEGHLQSRQEIDRAAAGHGLINADDVAPVIRSVPLIARIGSVTVPALTIEMLRTAQRAAGVARRVWRRLAAEAPRRRVRRAARTRRLTLDSLQPALCRPGGLGRGRAGGQGHGAA
jgi:adenylate cyclase